MHCGVAYDSVCWVARGHVMRVCTFQCLDLQYSFLDVGDTNVLGELKHRDLILLLSPNLVK